VTAVRRARHRIAYIETTIARGGTTLTVATNLGWLPRHVHRYLNRHDRHDLVEALTRNDDTRKGALYR
jgi:hypothetical protein